MSLFISKNKQVEDNVDVSNSIFGGKIVAINNSGNAIVGGDIVAINNGGNGFACAKCSVADGGIIVINSSNSNNLVEDYLKIKNPILLNIYRLIIILFHTKRYISRNTHTIIYRIISRML